MNHSATLEGKSVHSPKSFKVLLIDDSVQDFRLISVLVKNQAQNHYTFDWARNSKEAQEHLKKGDIDIVAVDYNLGLEYGSEVIAKLSDQFPDLPYLLVTGNEDPSVYKKGLQSGAENFVSKGKDCGAQFDRAAQFAMEHKRVDHSLVLATESKDWLLSLVARDLTNPLFALNELLSTLVKDGPNIPQEKLMELLKTAFQTSCESIVTANEMMEWGRNLHGSVKPQMSMISLETVFHRSMSLVAPLADEKDILLDKRGPFEFNVFSDERMLLSATRNLLSAAMFFAKEGTDITIEAEPINNEIVVTIRSSGKGIDSDLFEKLTNNPDELNEMPRTAEQQALISLLISNHLFDSMKNALRVVNLPQEGIEFTFKVPLNGPF